MPRKIVILLIAVAAAGGVYSYKASRKPANLLLTVELKSAGFFPDDLTVSRGETVIFVNRTSRPFWPASDVHPSHLIYPEFDPKNPIAAGGSWSFRFDKEGEWAYHDHLASYFHGRIIVTDADGKRSLLGCSDLKNLQTEKKEQCWEKMLNDALLARGVKYAFQVFTQIYASDPQFVTTSCHQHAHTIGDFAYAEFRKTKNLSKLDFPPETVYCNYGYYHGLIGHMVEENQDPAFLRQVCDYLENKYSKTIPEIRVTCYHGAGHGFVPLPSDEKLWGDAQAMIAPGLVMCDKVSDREPDVQQCLEGVFNVIALWMYDREYGLSPDQNAPFALCQQQTTDAHRAACYYEMAMPLNRYVRKITDLKTVFKKYVVAIKDETVAKSVVNSMVAGSVTQMQVDDDLKNYISLCRGLKTSWQESCYRGVTGGLVAHGYPGQEHVKAFAFCSSPQFTSAEKENCFGYLFSSLRWVYNDAKISELCVLVPEDYRNTCSK